MLFSLKTIWIWVPISHLSLQILMTKPNDLNEEIYPSSPSEGKLTRILTLDSILRLRHCPWVLECLIYFVHCSDLNLHNAEGCKALETSTFLLNTYKLSDTMTHRVLGSQNCQLKLKLFATVYCYSTV